MDKISIVVPCYNNEKEVPVFYEEIIKITDKMKKKGEFEFIFVNDSSKDRTLEVVRELSSKDKRVRYVSFSRNFGKDASIIAGLEASRGDFVGIMEVDLQDQPALIEEMYDTLKKEDYDCVATRRIFCAKEPRVRIFFKKLYYKIINKITKIEILNRTCDFRLMTRQMVDSIIELKEYNRFSIGLFSWVGYNTKWLEYKNVAKVDSMEKKNFFQDFLCSLKNITAFTTIPLAVSSIIGILFCLLSFILMLIGLTGVNFDFSLSLLLCIILFISGIQLFFMGTVGKYLSNIYLEVKARPLYIIKETESSSRNGSVLNERKI